MAATAQHTFNPSIHKTVSDVRFYNKANGFNWFGRGAMRFFGSRIETRNLMGGRYFITSEDDFHRTTRQFHIRRVNDDFSIDSFGFETIFNTKDAAKETLLSALSALRKQPGETKSLTVLRVAQWMVRMSLPDDMLD